jgi:hypothetical protein
VTGNEKKGAGKMDPFITPIVLILGKYALDKGVELGKEVGPKALETAKEIFALALDRLQKSPEGEVIAGEFEKDPGTYQKPVEKELAETAQADPDFAAQLKDLLAKYEAAAEEHAAVTGKAYRGIVTGSGALAQDGSVAAGERGVAVGGDVRGTIVTGDGSIVGRERDEEGEIE